MIIILVKGNIEPCLNDAGLQAGASDFIEGSQF